MNKQNKKHKLSFLKQNIRAMFFAMAILVGFIGSIAVYKTLVALSSPSQAELWVNAAMATATISLSMLFALQVMFLGVNLKKARNMQPVNVRNGLYIIWFVAFIIAASSDAKWAEEYNRDWSFILSSGIHGILAICGLVSIWVFDPEEFDIAEDEKEEEKSKGVPQRLVQIDADGELVEVNEDKQQRAQK